MIAAALLLVLALWGWSRSSAGQLARLRPPAPLALPGAVAGALPPNVRGAIGLCLAAAVMVVVPGSMGVLAGALAGAFGFLLLGRIEAPSHRRRRERLTAQLPAVAELLAVALTAGAPLRRAVLAVSEVSPSESAELLGRVAAFVAAGGSEQDAWLRVAQAPWIEPARDIVRSIDSGSALAETLRLHAAQARREQQAQRQSAAKRVGVRIALPLMCCFLPAFLAIGVAPIIFSLALNFFG